jgi:WD40 repeat protein
VLAAASDEGTVRSWRLARDLAPGGLVDPPTSLPTRHFRSPVADIAIDSKGGSIAAVTDDGWIHRWRIGTAASVATVAQVRPGNGSRLVYLGDGMLVCIDGRDISTWSSEGIRRTAAAPGASAITVAPGFAEVWVGTDGGVLQRWWVQSTPVLVGAPRQGLQSAAVAVAAGASVVTALDTGGRLVSWDADGTTSPAVHTLTSTRSSVTAVSAGPGNAFAAIDHGGEVWLGGSGARMRVVTRLGTAGAAVAWSADGQILAAGADGAVRLVPVTGGDPTYLTPAGPSPVTAMAAHGQLIATGFSDGRVEIRTRASILAQLRVPAAVTAVAVNATATIVAVASGDGAATSITVFHERDGRFLATVLRGHTSQVASLAFNPRGSLLASGSDDRMIALWSVPSGHRVDVWKAHTDQVRGLSFDATGQTLASGSEDSTIRLWDVASRRPLGQPLRGATGFVWSLSASANGQRLVAGHGNSVEEWPLDPDGWARQACTVARRNLAPAEWSQYAPGYRITTLCPGRFSPR